MNYTPKEILSFVEENDVKFIRLTFADIHGNLKNIAIMPDERPYAFEHGIPFDATTLAGCHSDLLLFRIYLLFLFCRGDPKQVGLYVFSAILNVLTALIIKATLEMNSAVILII